MGEEVKRGYAIEFRFSTDEYPKGNRMDFNRMYWVQMDPLYYLRHAMIIKAESISFADDAGSFSGFEETGLLAELDGDRENARVATIRLLRFQATDTFITALLGSEPHGPMARFLEVTRNDELNKLVDYVAKQTVHETLQISGVTSFSEWLSFKVFRQKAKSSNDILPDEIVKFVSFQAEFARQKNLYNAFKHGFRIGYGTIPEFELKDTQGSDPFISTRRFKNPVAWVKWNEKRNQRAPRVEIGVTECDPIDDMAAIYAMAMLLRAMRRVRIEPKGTTISLQLPSNIATKLVMPQNLTFQISL